MHARFPIPRSAWKYPAASDASQRSLVAKLLRLIPRRAGHSRAPKSRQLVTDCHRLKTVCLCIRQLVTTCHRLKISMNLGNLISSP